ncbi:MAG: hypothetical protein Q9164_006700 [Protoblastenia rupestris]
MAQLIANTALQSSPIADGQASESIQHSSPWKGCERTRSAWNAGVDLEDISLDKHSDVVHQQIDGLYRVQGERGEETELPYYACHSPTDVKHPLRAIEVSGLPAATVDLYNRANSIIHSLAPTVVNEEAVTTIVNGLQKPGSSLARSLWNREQQFNSSYALFTQSDYIVTSLVLRAAFNANADVYGPNIWRPDGVFQKANLARLACQIVPRAERSSVAQCDLMHIDQSFPGPYIESFAVPSTALQRARPGQSRLKEQTFAIALELRTQLAIARLEFDAGTSQGQSYSPEDILRLHFLAQQTDGDNLGCAKPWAIAFGRKGVRLTQSMSQAVSKRVSDIRAHCSDDGQPDFEALENEYPWATFKLQLIRWIRARSDEIEQGISINKGIDELASRWADEVLRRANKPSDMLFMAAEPEAIRCLNQRKRVSPPARCIERSASRADEQEDGMPSIERHPAITNQSIPARSMRPQHPRGRSIIDSQPGATQVVLNDNETSQTSRRSAKRHREDDEIQDSEASQNGAFEIIKHQPVDFEQRRAALRLAQPTGIVGMQRQDQQQQQTRQGLGQQVALEQVANSQAKVQSDDGRTLITPGEMYHNRVQPAATRQTALRRSRHTPQPRQSWTVAEVDQLLRLIERYGCSYARAKKEDEMQDNILGENERDAESIRQKARNMKFDYIKAGFPLPAGFQHVLLDVKFIRRLRELGVNYDQDEARSGKSNGIQRGD